MTKVDIYEEPLTDAHALPLESIADYKESLPSPKTKVSIVYLAVDSRESIRAKLVRHEQDWEVGFSRRNPPQNVKAAYVEGGEYGASVVLALPEESHVIQKSCDSFNGDARLSLYLNVRKSEVERSITDAKPDIFHFSGHCSQKYGLSFIPEGQGESSEHSHISEDELVDLFRNLKHKIELAFIASCNSDRFARQLVERKIVGIAIGTKNSVEDQEIVKFVACFYDKLMQLGYGKNSEARIRNVQQAYAYANASGMVSKKNCQMCIYPEPSTVRGRFQTEYMDSMATPESHWSKEKCVLGDMYVPVS